MSSTDKWIHKIWHIHKMKCYSCIKRNEVLTHAATWMNPENIMLRESSQTQKVTYQMLSLLPNDQNSQTKQRESHVVIKDWERGVMGFFLG